MQELPIDETYCVFGGQSSLMLDETTQTHLKIRAVIGALTGILIGVQIAPELMIAGGLIGYSGGLIMGTLETWVWL